MYDLIPAIVVGIIVVVAGLPCYGMYKRGGL